MDETLKKYIDLLWETNQHLNLISRKATREDLLKHIEDSLAVLRYHDFSWGKVLDMGSGQGLPAIPLAITHRQTEFVLVESERKKSIFLSQAAGILGLTNVRVENERLEILGRQKERRNMYDIVTARGLAEISILLEWGMPLLKIGGHLIAWKGPGYEIELENSSAAMQFLGGVITRIEKYQIDNKSRVLLFVLKERNTPDKYPRNIGVAKKRRLRKEAP